MLAMIVTVVMAGWSDWRQWRIPNGLLACSAVVALMVAAFASSGVGLSHSLIGGGVGLAVFLPFYLLRGMAAGDVKLLGVLGMYAGPVAVIDIALVSALVGGVWAVGLLVRRRAAGGPERRLFRKDDQNAERRVTDTSAATQPELRGYAIPYGVVMMIGTLIVLTASLSGAGQ